MIFLFSILFDYIYQGSPGIGFTQFAGMTIGLINILIGLRYLLLPQHSKWDWVLFLLYISGLFIFGLRPTESFEINQYLLLGMNAFSKRDFALNLMGFIPLGFLMLPLIRHSISNNKKIYLVTVTAFIGFLTSLVIETIQYLWIPGRFSSAYDLATNTLGTIIGAVCYLMFKSRSSRI